MGVLKIVKFQIRVQFMVRFRVRFSFTFENTQMVIFNRIQLKINQDFGHVVCGLYSAKQLLANLQTALEVWYIGSA